MDEQEIERLLYSGESDALDFKRDQYPLTNNDEISRTVGELPTRSFSSVLMKRRSQARAR